MTEAKTVSPIPIYVLAGVLGSGKTTLMTRLAKHCIAEGRRVGMLVNDIGDLGVDALLLAETGWPSAAVDALNGACACCSDSTDLQEVIRAMAEAERQLLLFETTGVADAADMLSQLMAPELMQYIQTPRLITIADLTRYPEQLGDDPLVQRQVALADLVVLSKGDLVDDARIGAARDAIRRDNPGTPILDREPTDAEIATILGADVRHEAVLEELLVDGPPGHDTPHTVTIQLPQKLNRERFQHFLKALPDAVLRAKGFVALDEDPSLHLFQFVEPHKFRLTPFSFAARPGLNMSAGPSSPYGVFIGTTLDEEQLRAGLAACVAESG